MLSERQEKILSDIVEHYVSSKEPVGSLLLAESKRWRVSAATLRNEMSALEKRGYITHQYTSSGRVPTAMGYRYYVDHFLKPVKLDSVLRGRLNKAFEKVEDSEDEDKVKVIARELAELSEAAVIVVFHKDYFYYTGFTYLFVQPEFLNKDYLMNVGESLDATEENLHTRLPKLREGINVFIGDETGFTAPCAFIASPSVNKNENSMIGILGPMRMDYNKNCGLLSYVYELIS